MKSGRVLAYGCLAFVALSLVPSSSAALDVWETPISNAAGLITAGTIKVYLQHPDNEYGRPGDTFHGSALLTAPSATSPVVTWTINHAHGCTTEGATTRTTSTTVGVVSSFDFDVVTTGTTCAISLRIELSAGALVTKIYDQQATVAVQADEPGFFELFGPTLAVVLIAAILTRVPVWVVPSAVLLGFIVLLLAFEQLIPSLVLLQAVAGVSLVALALLHLALRSGEFVQRKRKVFE